MAGLMMNTMHEFEEAVRTAVCTECIYPTGTGMCGEGRWKECPLNRFLPQAIDAVNAGRSASLIEYFTEFLQDMQNAESERPEGSRMPPDDAAWFDRFLPLIAQAVEEVKGRKLARLRPSTSH